MFSNQLLDIDSVYVSQALNRIQEIADNTNDWCGFANIFMSCVAISGIVAAWIALYPLRQIQKNQTRTKSFQIAVMDDLIRHFFINDCILRTIQQEYGKRNFEVDFLKLKVLPDDLNLNRFTTDAVQYKVLHNIEILMRNYGIHSEWTSKHCNEFTKQQLISSCQVLIERGKEIIEKLDDNKKNFLTGKGLTYRTFDELVKNSYPDLIKNVSQNASPELTDQIRDAFVAKKRKEWALGPKGC